MLQLMNEPMVLPNYLGDKSNKNLNKGLVCVPGNLGNGFLVYKTIYSKSLNLNF